jgi:hypothetical protein
VSTREREWNIEKEQTVLVPSSNSSSLDETVGDKTGLPTSERERARGWFSRDSREVGSKECCEVERRWGSG